MLSERLQLALDESNMSQADLARACGVKPPSVSGWLSGKSKFLRGENLLAAAQALGVSQVWLATGRGPMRLKTLEQKETFLPPKTEQTISVETALEVIKYAILSSEVAGSKALLGAFASFVEEPDRKAFQDNLLILLNDRVEANKNSIA